MKTALGTTWRTGMALCVILFAVPGGAAVPVTDVLEGYVHVAVVVSGPGGSGGGSGGGGGGNGTPGNGTEPGPPANETVVECVMRELTTGSPSGKLGRAIGCVQPPYQVCWQDADIEPEWFVPDVNVNQFWDGMVDITFASPVDKQGHANPQRVTIAVAVSGAVC